MIDYFGPDPWPIVSALLTQISAGVFHLFNAVFAARVVRKRAEFSSNTIVMSFIALNIFCCVYRFWGVLNIWENGKVLSPGVMLLTAMTSMVALSMIWLLVPTMVRLPTVDSVDTLTLELEGEKAETKRVRESLSQSQKMEAVGKLTGGIAHEFNNLLFAISGSLELINKTPDSPKVPRWTKTGLDAVSRAAHLTAQLLTFSRVQKLQLKDIEIRPTMVNLQSMISSTIGPNVQVFMTRVDDVVISTDKIQLELAIINLAINARDAMVDSGTLTISTQIVGDRLEIDVTDTGTGIPHEIIDRVFEPFFTTKETGKGTGLGLSMVYGVAQQSSGEVFIKSTSPKGTTITLSLPIVSSKVRRDPLALAYQSIIPHVNKRILLIDDDRHVRETLSEIIIEVGHHVHVSEDGVDALAYLKTHEPDLVLLDYAMPVMNGSAVAKAIKQIHPDIKIVFITGYSESSELKDHEVIKKPFSINDIRSLFSSVFSA